MAQSFVTNQGTLIIPGAYASYKVEGDNSGLATTGVLMLVGEAEAGPDHTLETDLELNAFGPDQGGDVLAKYRAGPLVDAFRAAAAPANDPGITGSPSRIILVKTNSAAKAKVAITNFANTTYGFIADKSYGKLGNLISATVSADDDEVLPTTSSFTFIPAVGTVAYAIRLTGGAALTGGTLAANSTPAAVVAAVNALAGISATGGADRVAHSASGTVGLAATGNTIVLTASVAWQVTPTIGDTLVITATSVIKGGTDQNVGAYVVTGATALTINATKLSDAGNGAAVIGTITAPVTVAPVAVGGTPAANVVVYGPATITLEAGVPVDGVGKTLEIAEVTTGTDLLSRTAFQLGTAVAVTWVSKTSSAKILTAATEYRATLSVVRALDSVSQDLSAGGEIALKIGYTGTTAALVITDTTLAVTVVGGAGSSFSLTLADIPTLADLAANINSRPGFTCSVGSAILGQIPTTALDNVTTTCCSQFGAQTGRVKIDGYRFFNKVSSEAALVQFQDAAAAVVQAVSGLPQPQTIQFLAGGTKGGTTAAAFLAAIDALQVVRGNFLVPLFSRDAAADIADNLTDSASTYVIDDINAICKSHVLAMSVLKKRRNRQAFLSKKTTFALAREAASNIASYRSCLTFQDVKTLSSTGVVKQFQPWMAAVLAAAMQAAGFYRPIVNKGINCSGVLQAARDYDDRLDSNVEDALVSGLLPAKRADTGGFAWVSDQTTYGKDSNFVFNSIQATYVADTIATTTAQRMERAFVGQSLADVSAPLALAFLQAIMTDFLRLKLLAPSDDAPKGFKNARIQIRGGAMIVSLEVKLAGAVYFIPVSFLVSQVTQTAST